MITAPPQVGDFYMAPLPFPKNCQVLVAITPTQAGEPHVAAFSMPLRRERRLSHHHQNTIQACMWVLATRELKNPGTARLTSRELQRELAQWYPTAMDGWRSFADRSQFDICLCNCLRAWERRKLIHQIPQTAPTAQTARPKLG